MNAVIASLLLVSYVGSNRIMPFNISSRTAVVAGKSVELLCDTLEGGHVQYWDHHSLTKTNGSWSWTRIYNGWEIRTDFRKSINCTRNANGNWILHITLVNISGSGYYKCVRSEQTNNTVLTSSGTISELIVFASDPQCNVSSDVFKEGEYIAVWCNLRYFGSIAPVMEWTKNGTVLDASAIYKISKIVNNSEVMSELRVKADSSLHNSKYSCNCYFEQSCDQTHSSQCKVPDYHYTWTSPILMVKYPSRSIDIIPSENLFHPGETITCSADGYPTPVYEWVNLKSPSVCSGPILAITEEMIDDTEYIYECRARNSENQFAVRRNVTFLVNGSFPILTVTTISVGILSILLLFAIIVIRLEYLKDWIAKITATFRSQINVEHGGEAVRQREAADVVHMVEEDPYGGYVGIREIPPYLEMRPDTEPDHNEEDLATGGIVAKGGMQCKSSGLHEREMPHWSYAGADGTEYMEMNGFRTPPTTNRPTRPRIDEPVTYAGIDHTLLPPSPLYKESCNDW